MTTQAKPEQSAVHADDEIWEPPDYGSPAFWEEHFAAAPHGSPEDPAALEFEWVCSDLDRLTTLLLPHLPRSGRVLHPGCGMSSLPLRLRDRDQGLEVVSVDSSASCVAAMRRACSGVEGLTWLAHDVRDLATLGEEAPFAAAIEKGCLDALLCDSDESAARYVAGLAALLPPGAPLLVVSNCPARHRHLTGFFTIQEARPLSPEDGPLGGGGTLYICSRRAA